MSADARAERIVLAWARAYTRGVDAEARGRRLEELASDCHEQRRWAEQGGRSPRSVALSMLGRTLAGMAADLSWRQSHRATAQDRAATRAGPSWGRRVRDGWWLVPAGALGVLELVLGIGLPFEDRTLGSVFGGIAIALLGATMLVGIWLRRRHREQGDVLIVLGTLPVYPFIWTIVLPALGIVVALAAIRDMADTSAAHPT